MTTDANGHPTTMQASKLRATDAKTHSVVIVWQGSRGDERYLYHDANGWYVLDWPCAASGRHYLTTDAEGFFDNVTLLRGATTCVKITATTPRGA